ncbi:ABC transporter permease [Lederbergia graminis]|uniref:ABC transporter permease n=1 Tax=Lederbergia graminis TaxID=735518 RepID=A0ABW0LKD8_9BACI
MRSAAIENKENQVVIAKKGRLLKSIKRHKLYYFLIIPGLLYFLIFHYIPMFGIIIAFKDVSPFAGVEGIFTSEWVGLKHFERFFSSYYFWDVLSNTVMISFYKLLFGFPAPIILALLLNEVRQMVFKRTIQTISYLPHFISMVVLAGLVTSVLSTDGGILNSVIEFFGGEPIHFLGGKEYFRSVLVASDIWKSIGWGSILYLAAMAGINPQLYEAAKIDGANRWQQTWHITLPGISFVVVLMLILNVGNFLDAGFEQILLLYSPAVYEVADIIDTYVYREGLIAMQYSYATAIGIFKNVIGAILILGANYVAKRLNQPGIW